MARETRGEGDYDGGEGRVKKDGRISGRKALR